MGSQAAPLSNAAIRNYAWHVREAFGLTQTARVDVEAIIDFALPRALADFEYEVMEEGRMGSNHGLAIPDRKAMIIRADVHEGACEGRGRDRFTVIHEVGHVLLHTSDRLMLRRGTGPIKTYCDPEWQADAFAGEFLAPRRLAPPGASAQELASNFGISLDAANTMIRKWRREDQ